MSSANNTLEGEDGKSTAIQESLPSTTSVLDKSRSLFGNAGNSSNSMEVRDATPGAHESSPNNDSPVAMVTKEEAVEPAVDAALAEVLEPSVQEEGQTLPENDEEEPMDVSSQPATKPEPVDEPEEEVFEKKIVSMDTSGDGELREPTEPVENEENPEGVEEDMDDIEEYEEEEEEAPKKKAKRAVPTSEDDEPNEESEDQLNESKEDNDPTDTAPKKEEDVDVERVEETEDVDVSMKEDDEELAPEEAKDTNEEVPDEQEDEKQDDKDEDDKEEKEEENNEGHDGKVEEEINECTEEAKEEEEDTKEEKEEEEETQEETEESEEKEEEKEEEDEEEEQVHQEPESSTSTRRGRGGRPAAAHPTPSSSATPRRGSRGRPSRGNRKAIETEEAAPKRRSMRGSKKEEVSSNAEQDEVADEQKEVEEDETVDDAPEEETATPKRGRGRRPASSTAAPTPRSARGRGRKQVVEKDVEEEEHNERGEESTKRTRTPRGRKSAVKVETEEKDDEEEVEPAASEEPTPSRRSARSKLTAKATPIAPPVTKKTPARGRTKQASLNEVINEDDEAGDTPPTKKGRGGIRSAPSSSTKKNEEFDPYDMDTEMEHHPDPLKNIHMEVHNFGTVKYGRVGASQAKYSMTEKAAESRIPELQASTPAKNRRSLADMTPGKEKVKHRVSMGTGGRKPKVKKDEVEEVEKDMPEEQSSSATAARGRKRKSDMSDKVAVPPPAKKSQIKLKELTAAEQLRVDNPHDDSDSYSPGARVYANFQKTFYPAIIVSERDGLGRYKLQFTADKVVKDVPNAGIVPIRAVIPGKTAILADESVIIDMPPNDRNSEEWVKGNLLVTVLDDEGEPTEETKTVSWTDLTFEHNEWKDYIKSKELTATAIVTSNITSLAEASRPRKSHIAPNPFPLMRRAAAAKLESSSSRGASTPRSEPGEVLYMKESAVGKKIFQGKAFMITSANRSQNTDADEGFNKNDLIKFLTDHGGIVAEKLDDRYPNHQLILISDTCYRTHKYLAALANAIPCIHYSWIKECGEKGECVAFDKFRLPAGNSIFDNHKRNAPEDPSVLLAGKSIFIHSTHEDRERTRIGLGNTFIGIWAPICKLLGAIIIEADWQTLEENNVTFDYLLADGTYKQEVMEYAKNIGSPTVTSEWVIQTIILSGTPDPTSHSKFSPRHLSDRLKNEADEQGNEAADE